MSKTKIMKHLTSLISLITLFFTVSISSMATMSIKLNEEGLFSDLTYTEVLETLEEEKLKKEDPSKVLISEEPSMITLRGHTNSISALCYSPDGKHLASGSWDKTVKIWKVESGDLVHTLKGHNHIITTLTFSPNGKYLASGSKDKTIVMWDVVSGKKLKTFTGDYYINNLAFSPDGKHFASATDDSQIVIRDTETGVSDYIFKGHPQVSSLRYSPDGKYMASGGGDTKIKIWNATFGMLLLKTLKGNDRAVSSLIFSPDGRYLISNDGSAPLKIWDLNMGTEVLKTYVDHQKAYSVVCSSDGKHLVTISRDNAVKIWEFPSLKLLKTIKLKTYATKRSVFGSNGRYLAIGSENNTIEMWDISAAYLTVIPDIQTKEKHIEKTILEQPKEVLNKEDVDDQIAKAGLESAKAELAKAKAKAELAKAKAEVAKARAEAARAVADAERAKAEAEKAKAEATLLKKEVEELVHNEEPEEAENTEEQIKFRGSGDPLKGLNVAQTPEMRIGNYYALLIGIDNYSGVWAPLKNAVSDARTLEWVLKSKYKFDYFRTLYNESATRINVIETLEWLIENAKEDDNVFIYYSGHGEFKQNLNKGYWVPVDAKTNSTAAYISNSDIQTYLGGIRSKHTLLISDACFSGDIFRGKTISVPFEDSERYYKKAHGLTSRTAITSGGIEPVMDGGKDGHSVFAYYLLKALSDNGGKYFDASQLYNNLKIPVINNSEQSPNFQSIKNTGDEGGQFIFIKK